MHEILVESIVHLHSTTSSFSPTDLMMVAVLVSLVAMVVVVAVYKHNSIHILISISLALVLDVFVPHTLVVKVSLIAPFPGQLLLPVLRPPLHVGDQFLEVVALAQWLPVFTDLEAGEVFESGCAGSLQSGDRVANTFIEANLLDSRAQAPQARGLA